ncbi:DUF5908 family protein [Rhizobium sp. CB3060]|uniref:DUF5908 family protein n=1 Tax=Rhizobium sp. CB3060 TaxID=3138255 RepID=UPI0040540545
MGGALRSAEQHLLGGVDMPVEIKELHIRVAVDAGPPRQPQAASSPGGSAADKDAIVAECVEQVLQIMQSKRDR